MFFFITDITNIIVIVHENPPFDKVIIMLDDTRLFNDRSLACITIQVG